VFMGPTADSLVDYNPVTGAISNATWNGSTISTSKGGTGLTTLGTANQALSVNSAGTALEYKTVVGSVASADGSVTVSQTGQAVDLSVAVAAAATNVVVQVRNHTGATLTKGTVVYINDAIGQIPTVAKALATSDNTSAQTLGMMSADLANNSNGFVTIIGLITGINTQAYEDGDQLYLSDSVAGTFTNVKPLAPSHLVYVGIVEYKNPSNGKIFVKVQNGYELDELHDVAAQSPSNGQTIVYNSSNQLWEKNTVSLTAGVNGTLPVANGGTGVTTSTGTGSVVLSNTPTLVTPQTNAINAVPVVSGAGNSLTITAGSGVGTGAGGNVILQPGTQGASGGNGIVLLDGLNAGKGKYGDIYSVVFGYEALSSLTGVYSANTAIGYSALKATTTGNQNVAIGNGALSALTTGYGNTAVGNYANASITTSNLTVAIGDSAGAGERSVSIGIYAFNLIPPTNSVAIGDEAGRYTTGTANVLIGHSAGYRYGPSATALTSGIENTLIGNLVDIGLGNATASNCIVLGSKAFGRGSNTTTIGNSSTTATYIAGSINPLPLPTAQAVTAATGNGTTVTYTCANTFSVGQVVSITGLTITTGSSLNLSNQTITTASATQFTITNATSGTAVATQAGTATIQSAGNSVTITAGNGSGVGAGGNIILQPGAQGSSGGNGIVRFYSSAGVATGYWDPNTSSLNGGDTLYITSKLKVRSGAYINGSFGLFDFATANNASTVVVTLHDSNGFRMNRTGIYGFSNDVYGTNWTSAATDAGIGRADFGVTCVVRDTSKNGGSLSFPSTTTAFSANTNDLVLTASAFQRINCTSVASLTGIAPPSGGTHVDGRMVRVYNVGTANLTLAHNSASSTAANKFWNSTGADIIILTHQYVELIYDGTDNGRGGAGWRVSSVH